MPYNDGALQEATARHLASITAGITLELLPCKPAKKSEEAAIEQVQKVGCAARQQLEGKGSTTAGGGAPAAILACIHGGPQETCFENLTSFVTKMHNLLIIFCSEIYISVHLSRS